jgi:hypothetical protein
MLSDDVFDVVLAGFAECDLQAMCALFALCREAVLVFAVDLGWLLTVADEVDYWIGLGGLVLDC